MPHRTSKHGTFKLDRLFQRVGRINLASGATTAAEFHKRDALLTRLYDQGRLDLLKAIKAGTLTVTEVYAADRQGQLDTLTGDRALLNANLWDAVKNWTPTSAPAKPTRRRYATSFATLERSGVLKADATVGDLAGVEWRALAATWNGGASDWNHLRRAVSRFLTLYLGDLHHPMRRAVVKAIPTRKENSRVPDLPLPLFWSIVQATPEFVRAAYVTMAALGLRVGEYLKLTKDHLLPHTLSVRIPGTKTAESAAVVRVDERLWPWVEAGVPSPLAYKWLREYFKRGLKTAGAPLDLRLHDLRHCYAQWLVDAGASEAPRQVGVRPPTGATQRRDAKQREKGGNAKRMSNLPLSAQR